MVGSGILVSNTSRDSPLTPLSLFSQGDALIPPTRNGRLCYSSSRFTMCLFGLFSDTVDELGATIEKHRTEKINLIARLGKRVQRVQYSGFPKSDLIVGGI